MTQAQIDTRVAKSPLKLPTARTLPKHFTAIREVDFPDGKLYQPPGPADLVGVSGGLKQPGARQRDKSACHAWHIRRR